MASRVVPAKGDKVYRMNDSLNNVLPNGEEISNTTGNIVKFQCDYAKDFSKVKHMKQDKIYTLHVVHAEKLVELGIGKIIKDK